MKDNNKLYYKKILLHKDLENVVKYAWIMKSQEVVQSEFDLLIPDGYPEIIFVLNGVYHKKEINTNQEITIENSCVVGIQNQSVLASRGRLGAFSVLPTEYLRFERSD